MFGAVKLTTNADTGKYKHSAYGTGFDASWFFSLSDGSRFWKNVTIFGENMSSSMNIDHKKYLDSW